MRLDFSAWLYDVVMVAVERSRLARWRQSVVRPARGRVLEIGAGTGLNFSHYWPGVTVVATDVDSGMLSRARARAARANATVLLVAADAEALPFPAGMFDGAVIGLALCTVPRPETALAEVCRAVRSGGAVRLLEHVRAPNPIVARLQDWLTPAWRRLAGDCRLNRDALRAVSESGLQLKHVTTHAGGCVLEILAQTPAHIVP
jgi:ubiquinone/menaquinone biosynthesis C-methylase UbiE